MLNNANFQRFQILTNVNYINASSKFEILKINIEKMRVIKQKNDINDGLKKNIVIFDFIPLINFNFREIYNYIEGMRL